MRRWCMRKPRCPKRAVGGQVPAQVPTDVVRLILRRVDFEVFTCADPQLQRYMILHDMIEHEHARYIFAWAVHPDGRGCE